MANYTQCPKNPQNCKNETIPTIRNSSKNEKLKKLTCNTSYASVAEGVYSSKFRRIENSIVNLNVITESDSSDHSSTIPGFGKLKILDLFNNYFGTYAFILKLPTISDLLEKFIISIGVLYLLNA